MGNKIFQKIHAAKWIGAEQLRQILTGLGITTGTGGGLDASAITSGTIDSARLPSYVDDVVEYDNLAAFPVTGETSKIYVAKDTGGQYRWSGSAYIRLDSDKLDKAGDTITGTGGAGYLGAVPQSSAPSAPASGFKLFADSSGRLSWIGTNGFTRTFTGAALTASRTYALPDRSGNMALDIEATATLSSSSGVVTIDLSADVKRYELTLTENVTSWVFNNPPVAANLFKEIVITVIQHASAAKTVVSPATTGRTAGGIAWVADTTLSSREALVLHCFSDATRTLFPTGRQV